MRDVEFSGVFPYLISPIDADGNVKEDVLIKLVRHLIECGVHGLTPLGSTGEFAYLTWEQRKRIVEIVVDTANGEVPVVAGVFHTSNAEASRQAKEFEEIGADGILAVLDTYFPLKQKQVFSYFSSVAKAVTCPIVIYNNPKFSKADLSFDLIKELADIQNVKYLKDASGNTGKLLTIVNNIGNKIELFSASASIPLFVMMLGGVGWMAGPACIIPKQSVALYQLAKNKLWDEALVLQKKLWDVNHLFQKYNLAACIKAGLEIQGFPVGEPVPPLLPLEDSAKEEIRKVLIALEIIS